MAAITGVLPNGFEYEIDDAALDDMELLEGLVELDNSELGGLTRTMERLLGKGQKAALYEYCRGENGRVSSRAVLTCIKDILSDASKKSKDLKN